MICQYYFGLRVIIWQATYSPMCAECIRLNLYVSSVKLSMPTTECIQWRLFCVFECIQLNSECVRRHECIRRNACRLQLIVSSDMSVSRVQLFPLFLHGNHKYMHRLTWIHNDIADSSTLLISIRFHNLPLRWQGFAVANFSDLNAASGLLLRWLSSSKCHSFLLR